MGTKTCSVSPLEIHSLSKNEIDRRIDSLRTEMTAAAGDEGHEELGGCSPRWICASELVRLMRPFLVLN